MTEQTKIEQAEQIIRKHANQAARCGFTETGLNDVLDVAFVEIESSLGEADHPEAESQYLEQFGAKVFESEIALRAIWKHHRKHCETGDL